MESDWSAHVTAASSSSRRTEPIGLGLRIRGSEEVPSSPLGERSTYMRRTLLVALFGLALALPFAAGAASPFPERIDLANGFRPEGIAIGPGHSFYVGSIPTGAVVRGDLRTGTRSPLVPAQAGRAAIGVDVDNRGRLFVAGGPTGHGYVYDANTGANIADYDFTVGNPPTFVNDVVVTRTAVWFTDSVRPFL